MKRQNLKRIITMGLIATSLITVAPMKANAEWKQDNTGWWYTEGSSYATGWRNISGQWYYFTDNGYMKTGWVYDYDARNYNSDYKKYYMNSDGTMRKDPITIDGVIYKFDNTGKCISEESDFKFIDNSTLEFRGEVYNYEKYADFIDGVYVESDDEILETYGVIRKESPFEKYHYIIEKPGSTGPGDRKHLYVKNGKVLEGDVQADNGEWYYIDAFRGESIAYGWKEIDGMWKYYDWTDGHQVYGNNVSIDGKTYTMSRNGLDFNFWSQSGTIEKGVYLDCVIEKSPFYDEFIASGFQPRK